MRRKDNRQRVQHMLDAAEETLQFTAGKTCADLLDDRQLQHACLHCLEIIGEAANSIDQDFRDAHPEIPWRLIIAMRHRLIHGYFDIELSVVWDTIYMNLPTLVPQLRSLLATE
ncbi:MAG: HepT-like ribonuclease domain-containing protein [Armatimonadota bacterium]